MTFVGGLVGYRIGSAQQQKEQEAAEKAAKLAAGGDAAAATPAGDAEVVVVPSIMGMGEIGGRLTVRRRPTIQIPKKTVHVIRNDYYSRLGVTGTAPACFECRCVVAACVLRLC